MLGLWEVHDNEDVNSMDLAGCIDGSGERLHRRYCDTR